MDQTSKQSGLKTFPLNWGYFLGEPEVSADFRTFPEDFLVDEKIDFSFTGEGEHVILHLQKRGDNTEWLARQIAQLADVEKMQVGYCGLKDRHAITTQWYSVHLPKGEEPDWQQLNSDSVKLLDVGRHQRKLRRGDHSQNSFKITLRNLTGNLGSLEERLKIIKKQGVPNYFGEQRFGRGGENLFLAERLLVENEKIKNRQRKGMAMSAARSYLFNHVLSERVGNNSWEKPSNGDPGLNDSGSATGPLWGRGNLQSSDECLEFESLQLQSFSDWCYGLEHVGLKQERRRLCLKLNNLEWLLEGDILTLSFKLPPGTYATAVLRELCCLQNVSQPHVVV